MCNRGEGLEVVDVFDLSESFCHDARAMFLESAVGVEFVLIYPFGFHDRGAGGNGADVEYFPAVEFAEIGYFEVLCGKPVRGVRGPCGFFVCLGLAVELLYTGRGVDAGGVKGEDEGGVEGGLS